MLVLVDHTPRGDERRSTLLNQLRKGSFAPTRTWSWLGHNSQAKAGWGGASVGRSRCRHQRTPSSTATSHQVRGGGSGGREYVWLFEAPSPPLTGWMAAVWAPAPTLRRPGTAQTMRMFLIIKGNRPTQFCNSDIILLTVTTEQSGHQPGTLLWRSRALQTGPARAQQLHHSGAEGKWGEGENY